MRLLTLIFFVLIFRAANGQNLSKKYIDDWIIKCDPKINERDIGLYVIDGKAFASRDSSKMDTLLKTWPLNQLLGINFGKLSYEHPRSIFVIIESKWKQSARQKRRLYKEAISEYKKALYTNGTRSDLKQPILTIDDMQVSPSDYYKALSKIKKKNIYAINIYKYPVPTEIYGQNAKNGLIQVWTCDSKKQL